MSHRIAALVFDGFAPFALSVAVEVFGTERPELDAPWWYELVICSPDPAPLHAAGGFVVVPEHGLPAIAAAGTVLVVGCPPIAEPVPHGVVDALRAAHARGARLASLCAGAFVLAATGLLDGRRATAHWRHAAALRERHPAIGVVENALYVDEGDILTSAGTAAALDLCLHIIRRDHGAAIANELARLLVLAPHRHGDQAQLIERPVAPAHDRRVAQAMEWALRRLAEPTTLSDLAQHAFMSPRTFSRHFREAVGESPMAWLTRQRVAASVVMLEESDRPVEEIAGAAGFATAAAYRKRFRDELGVSPSAYRRAFRERARPAPGLCAAPSAAARAGASGRAPAAPRLR